jgi:hypothetical protein
MQVGEGRPDAPVGTTLAMIEQAQKILNSVHKRMHAAQAQEFQLLVECFRENPESFWQRNKKPALPWDEQRFLQALDNCELVPQADPNTASHTQRLMKVMALKQLQQAQPGLYDPIAIDTAALQAIGWTNPEQFFAPPEAQGKPPPEFMKAQAELQMKAKELDIKGMEAQARAQKMQADTALEAQQFQANQAMHEQRMGLDVSKFKVQTNLEEQAMGAKTDEAIARERLQLIDLAQNLAVHPESAPVVAPLVKPAFEAVTQREMEERARRGKMPPMPGLAGGLPQ